MILSERENRLPRGLLFHAVFCHPASEPRLHAHPGSSQHSAKYNALLAWGASPCRQRRTPAKLYYRFVRPFHPAAALQASSTPRTVPVPFGQIRSGQGLRRGLRPLSRDFPEVPAQVLQFYPATGRQKSAFFFGVARRAQPDSVALSVPPEAVLGRMQAPSATVPPQPEAEPSRRQYAQSEIAQTVARLPVAHPHLKRFLRVFALYDPPSPQR